MAATVAKLDAQRGRQRPAEAGGPTVRGAIDGFLDSPDVRANPNTLRAYTSVLDRVGEEIDARRRLAEVSDDEIADALTGPWGGAKPATWNRNRAAVGSWLAWCAGMQHWAAPALPAAAQRRRENNDYTKAVSRSRIDRLCRRRDVPLREKTLWRLLYESASRASAVLALNVEDLDLPNKLARITAKGGDTMWITWGTDTAHLLPPPDRRTRPRPAVPVRAPARPAPPGHHRPPRHLPGDRPRPALGLVRPRPHPARPPTADGLRVHQLRHSSATHLRLRANVLPANVIMAKTGHKSLRSVQRYVKPGLAAVHAATETLSSPRRRG